MKKILVSLLLITSLNSYAQTANRVQDVQSVDALIAALYDVISGAPGTPRDWERFKNLFIADARLMPTNKDAAGNIGYRSLTPDDYITLFSSRINTGFYERELHRVTEAYGAIVHVFSTYETREKVDGPVTNRGINSIQLLHTQGRYYIMNITWSAESLGFPLPAQYVR